MAAQAQVPRPAVPLPATMLRTSCFVISTAIVLGVGLCVAPRRLRGVDKRPPTHPLHLSHSLHGSAGTRHAYRWSPGTGLRPGGDKRQATASCMVCSKET